MVNPHFAVPVVGVVLCAFLVFAFGFKSPVQPPSFYFEDETSKKGRARSKHKKVTPASSPASASLVYNLLLVITMTITPFRHNRSFSFFSNLFTLFLVIYGFFTPRPRPRHG